jgi:hypothetical protein
VRAYLIVFLAAATAPASAATLHTDTFDPPVQTGSTLGWEGGGPLPVHVATGGPAGDGDGYLKIVAAEFASHLASYNLDASWKGDYAAIGATRVAADLMSPSDSAPLEIRLVIFTSGGSRWTSNVAQTVPADGVWRSYNFSFAEADVTQAQGFETYATMLTTVDRAMLRHQTGLPLPQGSLVIHPGDFQQDYAVNDLDFNHAPNGFKARFGVSLDGEDFLSWQRGYGAPVGTLNADNIQLAAGAPTAPVPEPGAYVLAACVGAVMATRRRYSSRPMAASSAACWRRASSSAWRTR